MSIPPWQQWLRRLSPVPGRARGKPAAPRRRPCLETLEDRRVPANISADPFISQLLPPNHNGLAIHIHPHLTIIINGQQQVIPANTGIPVDASGNPVGFYAIHTHDTSGTLHVESPTVRTFFLHDFFDIWGMPFDQTHILEFHTAANNPITMTVNGQANNQYGNLVLFAPGGANLDMANIVITATNALPPGPFFALGGNGHVEIRRNADGVIVSDFYPFGMSYTGGVSVAVGDVNKDGFKDLVVSQTTGSAQVKVYDGSVIANGTFNPDNPDASLLTSFNAVDPKFAVGVNVAVGNILGDGYGDIVAGAAAGNPDVRVFSGKDIANKTFNPTGSSLLAEFFPYGLGFNIGANVAVGDLSHNGFADIATGATAGNPDVRVFSGKDIANHTFNPNGASLVAQFFAYGLRFNVGAFVAIGDTNGDGYADLITGASAGNPDVRVFNGKDIANHTFNPTGSSLLAQFFGYDLQFNVGASVATADFEGTGKYDILTGASLGAPHYRIVKGNASGMKPPSVNGIEGIPPDIKTGIEVGA
jgi:FG-GAP repeat protein